MAGFVPKTDGNGGVVISRSGLVAFLTVAAALGWGTSDLILGPDRVRSEQEFKTRLEVLERSFVEHKAENSRQFREVEGRADALANRIEARLETIEDRLDEAIKLLVNR